jgi:hypothetical protein
MNVPIAALRVPAPTDSISMWACDPVAEPDPPGLCCKIQNFLKNAVHVSFGCQYHHHRRSMWEPVRSASTAVGCDTRDKASRSPNRQPRSASITTSAGSLLANGKKRVPSINSLSIFFCEPCESWFEEKTRIQSPSARSLVSGNRWVKVELSTVTMCSLWLST